MLIRFSEQKKMFLIETENTTYAFNLKDGALLSAYWGEKLKNPENIPVPNIDCGEYLGDNFLNKLQYNSEFNGWSGRFYSEPTLKVTFADGVRDLDLKYQSYKISSEGDRLDILLKDVYYNFSVKLIYKIYKGLDIIDRNCVITNNTDGTVRLLNVGTASVNFPYKNEPYRLTSLGCGYMHEYDVTRTPITKAKTVLESRAGVSTTANYPYFAIDEGKAEENSGEVWFGSLQWSGNWKISVEQDLSYKTRVTAGLNDFDFCYPLKSGEQFETPVITLGYSKLGFSGASRQLHDYIRYYHYAGYWSDKALPILYNAWSTFGFDINEEKLMSLAELAADVGVEMFLVDDGWFSTRKNDKGGLGDWYPDRERFPDGLKPLSDKVKSLGMLFGLWIEPEMINTDTTLFKEHPDWLLGFPTREKEPSRNQFFLNLAKDEVKDFIISTIDRLIEDYGVDYLKWDMNRLMSQPGWPDAPEGEQQAMWVKYVNNLHSVFKHIAEKYPKVIFENCASGSFRNNLALAKWCPRANRSDNQDAVDMLYLHEGFTYVNLPSAAGGGGHISKSGSGVNGRICPMEFKAHAGMMGSLATCLDLRELSKEELMELEKLLAYHKTIRHVVQLGDLYRLASLREKDYMAFEYVSKDKTEAVVFVFGPSRKFRENYPNIKLYGLDENLNYSVDCDDDNKCFEMTGDTLMKFGIPSGLHTVGTLKSRVVHIKSKN